MAAGPTSTIIRAVVSNWLILPELTLNNLNTFSFATRSAGAFPDRLEVRLSTNGSSTSLGDFSTLLLTLNPALNPGGYPTDWTTYTINLAAALEEWRPMLTWMASERCDLQIVAPHAVWVRADPALLLRCLLEVLKNSVDATGERKARIRVSCGFTHLTGADLESVRPLCNARPGSHGFLAVEDEGEGIDPAIMPRVFDPFFSTRFLGRGLGLPLVLMHVKRMQGVVQIHSTPHVGTRTRLLFAELPEFDA